MRALIPAAIEADCKKGALSIVLSPVHLSSPALDNVLLHLKGVRSSLRGWTACCPAHADSEPSLSIGLGEQGQVLLKCFAGCSLERIVEAMGLSLVDLFPGETTTPARGSNGSHQATLSLLDLALEKQLPWQFLFHLGIMEHPSGGLHIPYHLPDGTPAPRSRIRTALVARQGSRWSKGIGKIVPYGLQRLEDARKAGYLVLVEGESDRAGRQAPHRRGDGGVGCLCANATGLSCCLGHPGGIGTVSSARHPGA